MRYHLKTQSGAKPKWKMQHVFDKIKPLNIDQTNDVCWFIQQQVPQYGLELLIFLSGDQDCLFYLTKQKV